MPPSKLIVIVGITGNQGSSVANNFLDLAGWHVRGITRNPSSSAAQAWITKGVEFVKANLDDVESLEKAFSGASAIFAVTDFWSHFYDPINIPKAQQAGLSINEYAYNREIEQGMNMAVAANSSTVLSTLTHYVFSTLSNTKAWSHGKYNLNFHFDSKATVTARIRTELPGVAAKLSTVHVGMYASNWKLGIGRPERQDDGSFLVLIPNVGENPLPWVVTNRDTGVFVKALVEQPQGMHVLACSQMASFREFWTLWSDILGKKVVFKAVRLDEYFNPLPEPARKEMEHSLGYITEFGYVGADPEVLSLKDLDPHAKTTTLRDYIVAEDWSDIVG